VRAVSDGAVWTGIPAVDGVRVGVRHRLVREHRVDAVRVGVVVVTGEVETADHLGGREERRVHPGAGVVVERGRRAGAAEVGVGVVDAGVDDTDGDVLADVAEGLPDGRPALQGHRAGVAEVLGGDRVHSLDASQAAQRGDGRGVGLHGNAGHHAVRDIQHTRPWRDGPDASPYAFLHRLDPTELDAGGRLRCCTAAAERSPVSSSGRGSIQLEQDGDRTLRPVGRLAAVTLRPARDFFSDWANSVRAAPPLDPLHLGRHRLRVPLLRRRADRARPRTRRACRRRAPRGPSAAPHGGAPALADTNDSQSPSCAGAP
jgi:hypothetical protein